MATVLVNYSEQLGKIKPVHGVGQSPNSSLNCSKFHYLKEANIPFSRLHNVGGMFGGNVFVDIPNLFRDFDADPSEPQAYDFTFTDVLLSELMWVEFLL